MKTPKNRGFQMPAEWHPHRRCWMAWPTYGPAYFGRLEACKVAYANVARAISRFEPAVMLANEADLVIARTLCGPAVEVRPVPIDDGWFRDNGPTFLIDGRGASLGVDWGFNGWGAFANSMPVIACNRIGTEKATTSDLELTFFGSSFIADQLGAKVEEADSTSEAVLVHTFDLDACRRTREYWSLFRDRRPDLYASLLTYDGGLTPSVLRAL